MVEVPRIPEHDCVCVTGLTCVMLCVCVCVCVCLSVCMYVSMIPGEGTGCEQVVNIRVQS